MSSFVGQASQGVAAAESSTNDQNEGINSPRAIYTGKKEAAATGGESFKDSGFFEDDESYTPRGDYEDFQLYRDDLSEIDPDTDKFFADADASVQEHAGSFYSESNDSGVDFDGYNLGSKHAASDEDALFFNTVREVAVSAVSNAIFEALEDYDARSQSDFIPTPPPRDEDVATTNPLRFWVSTYLHHEHIAYQLLQQPQPVRDTEV